MPALGVNEGGVALLVVTHRGRAELFVEQFASLSMTVTIEPAEAWKPPPGVLCEPETPFPRRRPALLRIILNSTADCGRVRA